MIVPNLIMTAPTMFSSTLDDETLKRRRNQVVFDSADTILLEMLDDENAYESTEDAQSCAIQDIGLLVEEVNDADGINYPESEIGQLKIHHPKRSSTSSSTSTARKSKRASSSSTHDLDNEEKELKSRRLQPIIKHESEIFIFKKSQEEELHELAKAKSAFDLRAAKAAAELAELLLAKERNK